MPYLWQDVKALAVVVLLMAVLYPTVKRAAERRAERIMTAYGSRPAPPIDASDEEVVPNKPRAVVSRADEPQRYDTRVTPPLPERNLLTVSSASSLLFPVADRGRADIISIFGDARGTTRKHKGIDIDAPTGTPVIAVTDGFIERVTEKGLGGKQVWLRAGDGRQFFYAHLSGFAVEEMDVVQAGDVLGYVGQTGNASTPHLHFEIMVGKREAIDPLPELFPGDGLVMP